MPVICDHQELLIKLPSADSRKSRTVRGERGAIPYSLDFTQIEFKNATKIVENIRKDFVFLFFVAVRHSRIAWIQHCVPQGGGSIEGISVDGWGEKDPGTCDKSLRACDQTTGHSRAFLRYLFLKSSVFLPCGNGNDSRRCRMRYRPTAATARTFAASIRR